MVSINLDSESSILNAIEKNGTTLLGANLIVEFVLLFTLALDLTYEWKCEKEFVGKVIVIFETFSLYKYHYKLPLEIRVIRITQLC